MNFLQDIAEAVLAAAARIWPGVLAAALCGYLGWQAMGFAGFWAGAAAGALGGTWAGDRFGLLKVRAATGQGFNDLLIPASGAFAIVAVCYLLLQFIYILAIVAAVIAIAAAWLSS
jgi:hypothetical protein